MDLLLSADGNLAKPAVQHTVLDLLDQHAGALVDCGEVALARRVDELVTGLRYVGKSS